MQELLEWRYLKSRGNERTPPRQDCEQVKNKRGNQGARTYGSISERKKQGPNSDSKRIAANGGKH
jgi:hypothetical protein